MSLVTELWEMIPPAVSLPCFVVFSRVSWLSLEFLNFSEPSAYGRMSCNYSIFLALTSKRSIILIISAALFDSWVSTRPAIFLELFVVLYFSGLPFRLVFFISPTASGELYFDSFDLFVDNRFPDPSLILLLCFPLLSSLPRIEFFAEFFLEAFLEFIWDWTSLAFGLRSVAKSYSYFRRRSVIYCLQV